jgi:hypothetical protein
VLRATKAWAGARPVWCAAVRGEVVRSRAFVLLFQCPIFVVVQFANVAIPGLFVEDKLPAKESFPKTKLNKEHKKQTKKLYCWK